MEQRNKRYCVIMAGGIGSRFWPLSKDNYPKQFLDILGTGKSFIRSTFERFLPVVPAENFVVVTNKNYKQLVLEHLPELKENQVLCEPMRRNTAPCIAYANYHIKSHCPEASVVVTPADHLVTNEREFQHIIEMGFDFVEQPAHQESLLTIGIKPSRPETGYGYIEIEHGAWQGPKSEVVPMSSFKEKPDLETAKKFLAAGNFFWNSGIFVWSMEGISKAFASFLPDMVKLFNQGTEKFGTDEEQAFIDGIFPDCENISIDYGVMERSTNRFTIPADFGWSDIGTWGSLFTHAQKDADNNAVSGKVVTVDTHNTIVNVENGTQAIVQGLDNCLVAYRDKSLLVCRLEDEQQIKHWVEKL
ncbi:MAG: mannose-1-phosphate guanylyltransferase [Bacteroidales bacterium]|nr:mannose-1-phosphate guanylyltransferase [Candidatus Colimorpha pelethequi]